MKKTFKIKTDPSDLLVAGAMGAIVGFFVFAFFAYLLKDFLPEEIQNPAFLQRLAFVFFVFEGLFTSLGVAMVIILTKTYWLRDFGDFINTVFYDHQDSVNKMLRSLALDADRASKIAIGIRTGGPYYPYFFEDNLSTEKKLKILKRYYKNIDKDFYDKQERFFKAFDLMNRLKDVLGLKLKKRDFREHI